MKKKLSIDPFPVAPQTPLRRIEADAPQDDNRSALMLSAIAVSTLVLVAGITYFRMDFGADPQQAEFAAPATPGAAQLQVPETRAEVAPVAEPAETPAPQIAASLAPAQTVRPPAARPAVQSIQDVVDQSQVDAPAPVAAQVAPETAPEIAPEIAETAPEPEADPVQVAAREPEPAPLRETNRRKPVLAIVDEDTGRVKELALDDLQALATLLKSPDDLRDDEPLPMVARAQTGDADTPPDPNAEFSCVDALRVIAEQSTVFFRSGGTQLTPRAAARIRNIGSAMQNCPQAIIQVSGHSDPSGNEQQNIAISWERADNTIAALQSMGFDTSRMDPVGFGSRIPVAEGDNGEQDDRRVEFQVMEKR